MIAYDACFWTECLVSHVFGLTVQVKNWITHKV